MDWHTFDKHIDRWSKVSQVLLGLFVLFITIYFSVVSGDIARLSHQSAVEQRHHQVKPHIELMNALSCSPDAKNVLLQFRNYGSGTALGLRLMIEYGDSLSFKIDHLFYPLATIIDTSGGIRPDGGDLGKDWIGSNEALECVVETPGYSSYQTSKSMTTRTVYTIYLSYFDIDGTEYVKIFKNLGSGRLVARYFKFDHSFLDSLHVMSSPVDMGSSQTLENPGLRDESGWFKTLEES